MEFSYPQPKSFGHAGKRSVEQDGHPALAKQYSQIRCAEKGCRSAASEVQNIAQTEERKRNERVSGAQPAWVLRSHDAWFIRCVRIARASTKCCSHVHSQKRLEQITWFTGIAQRGMLITQVTLTSVHRIPAGLVIIDDALKPSAPSLIAMKRGVLYPHDTSRSQHENMNICTSGARLA